MYTYWIMKSGDGVEIASIVKILEMYPKAIHVAGGTHVDMCTQECEAVFDAVIVGPGGVSFKQIVEEARIGQLKKKYTMSYKDVPFAETPWPVREFVDRDSIVNTELFKQYGGTQELQCTYLVVASTVVLTVSTTFIYLTGSYQRNDWERDWYLKRISGRWDQPS